MPYVIRDHNYDNNHLKSGTSEEGYWDDCTIRSNMQGNIVLIQQGESKIVIGGTQIKTMAGVLKRISERQKEKK